MAARTALRIRPDVLNVNWPSQQQPIAGWKGSSRDALAKERGPTALVDHLAASRSEVRKGIAAMRLDPQSADFGGDLPASSHEADERGRKLGEAGRSARAWLSQGSSHALTS